MFGGRKEQNKDGNIQNKTTKNNKRQQKATKGNNKKRKTQPQHKHKKNSQLATHYQPKSHRNTTNQPQHNKSTGQNPQNGTLSQILKPTGEQRGPRFRPQGGCLAPRQLPKYFAFAPIKTLQKRGFGAILAISTNQMLTKTTRFCRSNFYFKNVSYE